MREGNEEMFKKKRRIFFLKKVCRSSALSFKEKKRQV
jgi:hypothetical protein